MKKIYHIIVLIAVFAGVLCVSSYGNAYVSHKGDVVSPLGLGPNDTLPNNPPACSYSSDRFDEACMEYMVKLVLLQEGFDNDTLPEGWQAVDNDGDGYTWDTHTPRSIYTKHAGPGCVSSASFVNNYGALTPDNWLITPAIAIPANGNARLTWWATAQDLRYKAEHYEVYVSTQSSAIADFDTIPVFGDTLSSARDYSQHVLDLSAYSGQVIYIAFVHNKCNDQYWLNLDDILIEFSPFDSVRTESGVYTYVEIDPQGCVDTVNLHYSVYPSYNQTENLSICQADLPYMWRDTLFGETTVSGDYTFYRQSVGGCDSVVTLHLAVNNSSSSAISIIACGSYTWFDSTYTQSGVYTHTIPNVAGCDSVMTLTLTVNPVYEQIEQLAICQNELPYTWCDTFFGTGTVSGEYVFHRQTILGCDSIVRLNLTVHPMYAQNETLAICQHELPYTWRDTLFAEGTVGGDFVFNRQSQYGCDSVVTLHLTVNQDTEGDTTAVSCDSFVWFGTSYTQSGDYTHTLTNVAGCDSVVTLHLTINQSTTGVDEREACDSLVWIDGQLYTESTNEPTVTLTNAIGCDSVISLHLTIHHSSYLDVYLTISDDDLPYTYGDTTFLPGTVQSGDYPFYFTTAEGCDSIIVLHLTLDNAINDHGAAAYMNVYPNPTTDKVNVQLRMYNEPVNGVEIQVYDMYGKRLGTWQMTGEITEIDLSSYAAGVYFIKAVHENTMIGIHKVLKQ